MSNRKIETIYMFMQFKTDSDVISQKCKLSILLTLALNHKKLAPYCQQQHITNSDSKSNHPSPLVAPQIPNTHTHNHSHRPATYVQQLVCILKQISHITFTVHQTHILT